MEVDTPYEENVASKQQSRQGNDLKSVSNMLNEIYDEVSQQSSQRQVNPPIRQDSPTDGMKLETETGNNVLSDTEG